MKMLKHYIYCILAKKELVEAMLNIVLGYALIYGIMMGLQAIAKL